MSNKVVRRFVLPVVALMVAVLGAQPAHANGIGSFTGCNDVNASAAVRICLYKTQGADFSGGYWQRTWGQIGSGCQNLSLHRWHTGGVVNNQTLSFAATSAPGLGGIWRIRVYDHVNCSSANGFYDWAISGNDDWEIESDTYTLDWVNKTGELGNSIGSIQIFRP